MWVHIDLPGVLFSRLSGRQQNTGGVMPMDDSLDITVERTVLTIAAERNWQRQETDQPYFGERYRGAFRRQIQLGDGLDLQNLEADLHRGRGTDRSGSSWQLSFLMNRTTQ